MTDKNSLGIDPLTNSNSQLPNLQNFSTRESGYSQVNMGPINLDKPIQPIQPIQPVQPVQPIQPINIPVQTPPVISPVSQQNTQTLGQLPPLENIQEPIVQKDLGGLPPVTQKKESSSEGKINIVLVIAIFLVVILVFVLIVLVLMNNANNKKGTDNSLVNISQKVTNTLANPTMQADNTDNIDAQAVYDNARISITSPLPNQFISKEGVTINLEGRMKGFFEGTMGYRILDEFDTKLATGVITADGDNYIDFVVFSKQITISPFTDSVASRGKIEFYETSMRDGSINVLASIPLKFQ